MKSMSSSGKQGNRNILLIAITLISCIAGAAFALGAQPSHSDRMNNPVGCSACHKGHGKKGTQMLNASKDEFCYTCHGLNTAPQNVRAKTNILLVVEKRSRHPLRETSKYHTPGEDLPETNPATPRHVACADCHSVHKVSKDKKWEGIKGYTRGLMRGHLAEKEYEVCYNCHSDSLNLPVGSKNMREEFSVNNQSFHPIEAVGRNKRVPSLIRPLNESSMIQCTDCHGNDDPYGPQGPHGSNYDYLLKYQYLKLEGAESVGSYELCYSCHDRNSVLNNDSFKSHKEHVVFNHIPCSACHTPHGSRMNQHLMEFDLNFIDISSHPSYLPSFEGKPKCLLTCHVWGKAIVHDSAFYLSKNWQ